MGRISASQDALLAIGDNPATDQEGAQGMALPCVLVGPDPRAHFQNLAELMQSRRPPRGSEAVRGRRVRQLEFLGDPGLGLLQDAKSNLNGGG
jgi:hypothetical protein